MAYHRPQCSTWPIFSKLSHVAHQPERVFLGWDQPCLAAVVDYLHDKFAKPGLWDLGQLTLVLPVASARRRLQILLAQRGRGTVLVPPTMVTPGQLPELLYESSRPVADSLTSLLTRMHVLRQADRSILTRILPTPPTSDDWRGWMNLAQELAQLHETLAAEGWQVSQVGPKLEATIPDFVETPRWQALASLQAAYESALAQVGLCDLHNERLHAARTKISRAQGPLVLVALLDLSRMLLELLEPLADQVTVLIQAPEQEAAMFDVWGALHVQSWMDRHLPLDSSQIHIVDRPRDQAQAALRLLAQVRQEQPARLKSTQDVTIGLGDASLAQQVQRSLEQAGLPARPAQGDPMSRSRPVLFLQSWAAFLSTRQWHDLAALLRHPDVEAYLLEHCGIKQTDSAVRSWQTLLDEYLSEHLQGRLTDEWLGKPNTIEPLRQVVQAIDALAPGDGHVPKSLAGWGPSLRAALLAIYGSMPLNRAFPADDALYHALQHLASWLDSLATFPADHPFSPRMTLSEAIGFTLAQIACLEIPQPANPDAIALLGWLELPLDDTPVLILTGVNEGYIPDSKSPDAFLPDRVRRVLGLIDNQRRYARDAAHLTAMLHQRRVLHLIAGRRGADDDPLIPSRLLLACEPTILAQRVLDFYDPDRAGSPTIMVSPANRTPSRVVPTASTDRFTLPWPVPPFQPINRLRVTAFGDYLACPYRFYLKHVLKLRAMTEPRPEMDALHFGTLAHAVLENFGCSDWRQCQDISTLQQYLHDQVDELVMQRYGASPGPAIVIQTRQLKERLSGFARWQIQQIRDGWRIIPQNVERELSVSIDVDGEPFILTGRIDRMDQHIKSGQWRLLDYKTGDRGQKPQKIHRQSGQWVDLQLPLYRELVMDRGMADPQVGYILLPKKVQDVGAVMADWKQEDYQQAREVALHVMRQIRAGVFWPPGEPIDDELAALCMDEALDRRERIARSGSLGAASEDPT